MSKKLLIAISIFMFAIPIFAQDIENDIEEETVQTTPPEMTEQAMAKIKADNPEFAQFQEKYQELQQTINAIVQDYRAGKINRKTALEKLKAPLKEQIRLMNDQDFLVAQQSYMLLSGQ